MTEDKQNLSETSGQLLTLQADVLNDVEIERVMDTLESLCGRLDIFVTNFDGGRWGNPIAETTDMSTWREVYRKNAGAASLFTMHAIPLIRRRH